MIGKEYLDAICDMQDIEQKDIEIQLGLPIVFFTYEADLYSPGTMMLLKAIYHLPWLLEVADARFDEDATYDIVSREFSSELEISQEYKNMTKAMIERNKQRRLT